MHNKIAVTKQNNLNVKNKYLFTGALPIIK